MHVFFVWRKEKMMMRQEIQEALEIIECALQTPIEVCEANKEKYKKSVLHILVLYVIEKEVLKLSNKS